MIFAVVEDAPEKKQNPPLAVGFVVLGRFALASWSPL
jgi:hypothetical protein